MKYILYNLLILFIVISWSAKAQAQFIDRVSLRNSFQSTDAKAEPASFTYTNTEDKPASWLLNVAVGYDLLANNKTLVMTLDPFVEYHKNTLVDKEQDVQQAGIALEWQTFPLEIDSKRNWSPILLVAQKYSNDDVKSTESIQGNIYLTYLQKKKGLGFKYFYIPNHPVNLGNILRFEYAPYIGLENENRFETEDELAEGNIYRFLGRVTPIVSFFPTNENLRGRIELYTDYQYRYDFSKTVDDVLNDKHEFFTASLNYTFFQSDDNIKNAKVGLDYKKGEDPTKGFRSQEFYAVTLKVKL